MMNHSSRVIRRPGPPTARRTTPNRAPTTQSSPAEVPELLIGMWAFSHCMRSHRVPDSPDPTVDSEGRPGFNLAPSGIGTGSSQVNAATHACQHLLPHALGGIPVSQRG